MKNYFNTNNYLRIPVLKSFIKFLESPPCELGNKAATTRFTNSLIPPYLYQTWDDKFFGKSHHKEILKFREINPDLNFIIFDSKELLEYMETFWGDHPIFKIFIQAKYGPMMADIFRYCILYERGGFYFDISKGCSIKISSFLTADTKALISYEGNDSIILPKLDLMGKILYPEKYILQWGMGFSKGHIILQNVIENICKYYDFMKSKNYNIPKNAILALTGPGMFTKTIFELPISSFDNSIVQAGIDFDGYGDYALKGSSMRYFSVPSYVNAINESIAKIN